MNVAGFLPPSRNRLVNYIKDIRAGAKLMDMFHWEVENLVRECVTDLKESKDEMPGITVE